MLINEILRPMLEVDKPNGHTYHADPNTGFYGAWGAGCIPMAESTGRFLIGHRSDNPPPYNVEQPGEWGTFGGKADGRHSPLDVAMRELDEETGYNGPIRIRPLYVFKSGSFRYYNFLAIVPDEFEPILNWENQDARWCEYGHWPQPMHFGLKAILADPASVATMRQAAAQAKATNGGETGDQSSLDEEP